MLKGAAAKGVDFIRRQKRAFKVNMSKNVIQNFSLSLTQQYHSIYISELGAGPMELGYVNSIGGVAATLLTMPAGWFADKYGVKKLLLFAISLFAVSYAAFGLAWSWQMTIIAFTITTVAACVNLVACPMVCGGSLRDEERVTGMQLCDTIAALPRLFGPLVAAVLITGFGGISVSGIRPLFWLGVVGLLVALGIIYFYFEDLPRGGAGGGGNPLHGIRRIFAEGIMVKRWLLYRMISSFPRYMAMFIPLYARELKGANQYVLGTMDSAYWLTIVLLALPVGLSADRFGRRKLLTLMTPIYSVSMILMVYAPNSSVLVVASLLSGFTMIIAVTQGAINAEVVPKELHGSWFGLNGFARGVMNIISPILGGLLWETLGPQYVLYFLAVTQVAGLSILATMPSSLTRN